LLTIYMNTENSQDQLAFYNTGHDSRVHLDIGFDHVNYYYYYYSF
jgi:hypothetical protein